MNNQASLITVMALAGKGRNDIFRDEVKEHIIDTCLANDTREWETGICRDGLWTIVEQYEDKGKAKKGHKKWVNKIKKNSKIELKEILEMGF